MQRRSKVVIVFWVAALGLWGCARPSAQLAMAERLKQLETKCGKLEEDYRSVAAARDQARKRVAALEEERLGLLKDLDRAKLVAKERDELKATLEARTGERDLLQTRCERMKKGLQSLIGQDDALLPVLPPAPVTRATEQAAGKS